MALNLLKDRLKKISIKFFPQIIDFYTVFRKNSERLISRDKVLNSKTGVKKIGGNHKNFNLNV